MTQEKISLEDAKRKIQDWFESYDTWSVEDQNQKKEIVEMFAKEMVEGNIAFNDSGNLVPTPLYKRRFFNPENN